MEKELRTRLDALCRILEESAKAIFNKINEREAAKSYYRQKQDEYTRKLENALRKIERTDAYKSILDEKLKQDNSKFDFLQFLLSQLALARLRISYGTTK